MKNGMFWKVNLEKIDASATGQRSWGARSMQPVGCSLEIDAVAEVEHAHEQVGGHSGSISIDFYGFLIEMMRRRSCQGKGDSS